jgi:transcription antitermination protein NusB
MNMDSKKHIDDLTTDHKSDEIAEQEGSSCEPVDNREPLKKRTARAVLFHVLYAADIFDFEIPVSEIVIGFNAEYETEIEADSHIIPTVTAIGETREQLDDHFRPFLKNWKYERIGYCTILILRYAIWEMLYSDTHHNIIINEAIELAKCFAEKDAFKFVNGILDKISKKHLAEQAEKAAAEAEIAEEVVSEDEEPKAETKEEAQA